MLKGLQKCLSINVLLPWFYRWMFSYLNFTENSQNFMKLEVFFKKPDLAWHFFLEEKHALSSWRT